jgi:Putative Actinobacterial Holin-X, holin superfamily III
MALEPPERGPAVGPAAFDRANGRSTLDPAHGGPLPDATMPELVGRLINDVSDLADRHIELAKQEIGEAKDDSIGAVKRVAIGAGIALAVAVLVVIWAWTAFIWFFNWLGALIILPVPVASQAVGLVLGGISGVVAGFWIGLTLLTGWRRFGAGVAGLVIGALVGGIAGLGWLFGVLVPCVAGVVAYRIIRGGVFDAMAIWPPLPRTRATLKGNLEWLQGLRTPNAR